MSSIPNPKERNEYYKINFMPDYFDSSSYIKLFLFRINMVPKFDSISDFKKKFRALNPGRLTIYHHQYRFVNCFFTKRDNGITLYYRCCCSSCQAQLDFHLVQIDSEWYIKGPVQSPFHRNCSSVFEAQSFVDDRDNAVKAAMVVQNLLTQGCSSQKDIEAECFNCFPDLPEEKATIVKTLAAKKMNSLNPKRYDPVLKFKNSFVFDGIPYLREYSSNPEMFVFAHPALLSGLKYAKYFSIDGTFKCVYHISPIHGYQLVTILYLDQETNVYLPAAHAIINGKEELHYSMVLNSIKSFLPEAPQLCTCDFEAAIKNALIQAGVPESIISGCLFHFRQALHKRYKSLDKTSQISNSIYIISMVLPFFQEKDFFATLNDLTEIADDYSSSYVDYLKRQWGNKYKWIQKVSHLIEIYSNNSTEAMHSQIGRACDKKEINDLYQLAEFLFNLDKSRLQQKQNLVLSFKKIPRTPKAVDYFRDSYYRAVDSLGISARSFHINESMNFFTSPHLESNEEEFFNYFKPSEDLCSDDNLGQFTNPSVTSDPTSDPTSDQIYINPFFMISPNDIDLMKSDVYDQIGYQ